MNFDGNEYIYLFINFEDFTFYIIAHTFLRAQIVETLLMILDGWKNILSFTDKSMTSCSCL